MSTNTDRPNPLRDAATKAGAAWASLAGLVSLAGTYGLLSGAQVDAIGAVGEQLPEWLLTVGPVAGAVVAAGATLVGSFGTAREARKDVTPNRDPRDHDGTPLVREDTLVAEVVAEPGAHRLDG